MDIHLIENAGEIRKLGPNLFESGVWAFTAQQSSCCIGGSVWFHRRQADDSYFGGRIKNMRVENNGPCAGRYYIVFEIDQTAGRGVTGRGLAWGREKAFSSSSGDSGAGPAELPPSVGLLARGTRLMPSLRSIIIDARRLGRLPPEFRVADVKAIVGRQFSAAYVNTMLSNSEVLQDHSPTYARFTIRRDVGLYEIHPQLLSN